MADLAQNEIKERQAQLTQAVITARNAKEQLTKEREVLRESLQLNGREARINELLHRFGLTLPTQEPQS
jgi:FtsZ-binding cell division protein ZapB